MRSKGEENKINEVKIQIGEHTVVIYYYCNNFVNNKIITFSIIII